MRRGTYSIVARDEATGELGVAVQSHWFGVGAVVAWARAGVGAVATQSVVEVAHGPNALDRLAEGMAAPAAVEAVLGGDELARFRQLVSSIRSGVSRCTRGRAASRTRKR
jgi:uncharacterized Ntn-hydrolase superfamily protein